MENGYTLKTRADRRLLDGLAEASPGIGELDDNPVRLFACPVHCPKGVCIELKRVRIGNGPPGRPSIRYHRAAVMVAGTAGALKYLRSPRRFGDQMGNAEPSDEYLDHIFWVVLVGKILGDVPRVRSILQRSGIEESRPLVRGYQYLVRVLMHEYLMSFERETCLSLEADIKTERSIFVGVDYEIRPLSSPLGIAVRNLGSSGILVGHG